jgi:tripartite-type tricarboxylate transporter receptor subunit TctC
MKNYKMVYGTLVICFFVFIASSIPAWADYPNRPIKILVGFRAGGGTDTMARLLSKKVGDYLGQPVVVVNKPGGGGAIAAKEILRAKPDGYTICFNIALAFAAWPHMTKVKYTEEDFTYISAVGKFQEAFVSLPNKNWSDWRGMISYAKQNGPLNVAALSPYDKMVLKYISKKEGVEFNILPTKGGSAIMTQILGNHVDFGFSGGIHYQYVKAGKMIVLAGHGQERLIGTPDVPTLKELGYNVALENYCIVSGPKGMPSDLIQKLSKAFEQAVQDPDYQDLLENKLHFPALYIGAEELPEKIIVMSNDFKAVAEFLK